MLSDFDAASIVEGDYDYVVDVDGLDFLIWQRSDGSGGGLASWQSSDGSSNASFAASTVVPGARLAVEKDAVVSAIG